MANVKKFENGKRVNILFDEALVARIDDYASKMHISRASAINVIISLFFEQKDAIKVVQDVTDAMNGLVDSQVVSAK